MCTDDILNLNHPLGEEEVWDTWISLLPASDMRLVFEHEVEWHDNFVSGEWSWADVEGALATARVKHGHIKEALV